GAEWDSRTSHPAVWLEWMSSCTRRDLPTPASPIIATTWDWEEPASCWMHRNCLRSTSRSEDYDRYCGQKSRWAYISPGTPLPRCKRWKACADRPITGLLLSAPQPTSALAQDEHPSLPIALRRPDSTGLTTTFERDWSKSAAS